jgi:hypothetical protein
LSYFLLFSPSCTTNFSCCLHTCLFFSSFTFLYN